MRANGTNWVATTNTFPNTATTGDILYASGSNVIGNLADVAVGQVLTSGGVGSVPAYSATPTVTSITFGAGSALSTYTAPTSWTPAITIGGSTTGITYTTQVGRYSQIGGVVFYSFNILLSSKGAQIGSIALTGLPVTVANVANTNCRTSLALWELVTLTSGYTTVFVNPVVNATTANISQEGSNQTSAGVTNTNIVNTSQFSGCGFYWAS